MKILFFTPYIWWKLHALVDISLYHGLKLRGHDVDLISCDGFLPECDLYWEATNNIKDSNTCLRCTNFSKNILNWSHIPEHFLGQYVDILKIKEFEIFIDTLKDEALLDVKWLDYNISEWVISSVNSHFRCNGISLNDKKHVATLRKYLLGAIKLIHAIEKFFEGNSPDTIVMFNGRMAPTRVMLEIALSRNIKVICHERGAQNESIQFYENENCIGISKNKLITELWNGIPLNRFELEKVSQWINNRMAGKNLSFRPFNIGNNLDELSPIIQKAKNDSMRIWTLFSSSTDEIIADKHIFSSSFDSQEEWIQNTIQYAIQNPDVLLLIKAHPNIGSSTSVGVNQSEISFFSKLKELHFENVIIIMPGDNVSTYSLIDICDLGLCSVSTVSIELASKGVPVICSMNSQFTLLKTIKYVSDKNEYFNILNTYKNSFLSHDEKLDLKIKAFRYIYANYYRVQLHYPLIKMPDINSGELDVKSINDFQRGNFDCLDEAVDYVSGLKSLVPVPNSYFDAINIQQERNYFEEQANYKNLNLKREFYFSVVIPCFNYASYLNKCLQSVANQTFNNFEIIIVNDGSLDNSLEVATSFQKNNPHIKITIISQQNSGQPAISRNVGIKVALGKYILPLDADDRINASYLENAYEQIVFNESKLDLIYFDVLFEHEGGFKREIPGSFDSKELKVKNQLCYASIYSKELWLKVGGYRENVKGYEDWDFWLACSLLKPNVKYVNKVGLIYNAKVDGLYSVALDNHKKLYQKIIDNNPSAYIDV